MSASVSGSSFGDSGAIALAKVALARANATVDADKRAHSPDCVACDQKLADRASADLQATRSSRQAANSGGGLSVLA